MSNPFAQQLGDPAELVLAAGIGEQFGYDEINLNCGCPSDRVQSGRFDAYLMAEPTLVGECVRAMREAVTIPVTVKCRIGIQPMPHTVNDAYHFLTRFVEAVATAGYSVFVIHAVSPKRIEKSHPIGTTSASVYVRTSLPSP